MGRPKAKKNNCTIKGVFRVNSTKHVQICLNSGILKYLVPAKIVANIKPDIPARTVRDRLFATP